MPTIQARCRSDRLPTFMKAFNSSIPEIATIDPMSLSLRSEKPMCPIHSGRSWWLCSSSILDTKFS